MRLNVVVTGAALVGLGIGIFSWKTVALDLPVLPSGSEGLWRVELEVDVRGTGRRGSVSVALPSTGAGQLVSDEHVVSDRLLFTIRTELGQRLGVWTGVFQGVHRLSHGFRVQLAEVRTPLPEEPEAPPSAVIEAYGAATPEIPAEATEIAECLASLNLPSNQDPAGRLRTIFGFVTDEIALVEGESDDALLTLMGREGSDAGKARLLATVLRADKTPARVVRGLRLNEARAPTPEVWVEAWFGGRWIPMSPSADFFAQRPESLLALRTGDGENLRTTGIVAKAFRYRSLRQRMTVGELASLMEPQNPVLAELSLYRLPVRTQGPLRLLLLLPLGALVMALMRNIVGVPTFGTFMPVLIALALRGTDLMTGLAMVASVIALGAASRLLLDRLHLLLVPRLCIVLCVVILTLAMYSVLGRRFESNDLFGGVLLPIVILAMLIERFSITAAEEGMREAVLRLLTTSLVAITVYPVFRSGLAESLFFGFPELVIVVMGVLTWVGGYTGYRLLELIRFRAFARAAGQP